MTKLNAGKGSIPELHVYDEACLLPEGSSHDRWIALLLFIGSCLYLRLFYNYTILNADEGIVLQGAQRILQGEVLYRDFFSFFTPGSYYWMALLFKIFGSSILVGRGALIFYGGMFSALSYLIARRVCARWSALLVAFFVTLTCLPHRFLILHNWDSTLWAYLALYCAVWLTQRPHLVWTFAMGFFAALTCLFEQSKGAGLVLGLGLGFLILNWSGRDWRVWTRRRVMTALGGFAGPFFLTFLYFGIKHTLPQLLADWYWPLTHYSAVNKVSFGFLALDPAQRGDLYAGTLSSRFLMLLITSPWFIVPVFPFLAVGCLAYWIAKAKRESSSPKKANYYILTSATLVGLLISIAVIAGWPRPGSAAFPC